MRAIPLLLCLLLTLCLSTKSYGQSEKDIKQASKLFEEAEKYYKSAEYEKALASYQESLRLSNNNAILFNIGQCYRQLSRDQEAITIYKNYLLKEPNSPVRATVEAFIKELEDKAAQQQAEKLFTEGERLYNVREYEQALQKYKDAYLLTAAPELLFNIGQCHRNLGRDLEAISSYKSFLRALPESQNQAQVEKLIAELEAKMKAASQPTSAPVTAPATQPIEPKKALSPVPFYAGAAGSLALGGFFGAAFLASRQVTIQLANTADSALLQDEINQQVKRTKIAGTAANAFVALSIVGGGLGVFAAKKKKAAEQALTVSLAPQQISLSGSF